MARHVANQGGWFKLWGKQFLTDDKIKTLGDSGQIAYIKLLCYSSMHYKNNGVFIDDLNNPTDVETLCSTLLVKPENFRLLLEKELIIKQDGYFCIKNWSKYQGKKLADSPKDAKNPLKTVCIPENRPYVVKKGLTV